MTEKLVDRYGNSFETRSWCNREHLMVNRQTLAFLITLQEGPIHVYAKSENDC